VYDREYENHSGSRLEITSGYLAPTSRQMDKSTYFYNDIYGESGSDDADEEESAEGR